MSDEEGKVVRLRPEQDVADEERMLKTRDRPFESPCFGSHRNFEIDVEARRVYCRACGAEVPAYDALLGLAREPERYIDQRKEAERRMRVARENALEAERLATNAKARLRSAVKKAPACTCPEEQRRRLRRTSWSWCPLCGGRLS